MKERCFYSKSSIAPVQWHPGTETKCPWKISVLLEMVEEPAVSISTSHISCDPPATEQDICE